MTARPVVLPGIMLSQTLPSMNDQPGSAMALLERATGTYDYRAVHVLALPDGGERREFGALVAERGLWQDFCLTRALGDLKLSLAAEDPLRRREAVDLVRSLVPAAVEQGARYLSVVSGQGHATEEDRLAALARFEESLLAIVGELRGVDGLGLLIEPLDVTRHKRGTLGYTPEAVELVRSLSEAHPDVRLVADTAHMVLNGEAPRLLAESAPELVAALHLCNCCLVSGHELYGDHHIKPGPPGELDLDAFREILAFTAERTGPRALPVFIEYRNHGGVDEHLGYLARAWERLDGVFLDTNAASP
jgi:sugar phosphate isomerase/epimerase